MAGIGIRYLEFARRLPAYGLEVTLVSPTPVGDLPDFAGEGLCSDQASLPDLVARCDVVVAQGQLANTAALCCSQPVVIDLYDPWLVENFHYLESLGLDPYRNDHASWMLQLARGDFFLCSSEEQRLFYLGLLTALGRVNPESVAADPDLQGMIAAVPFGLPRDLPPHRPVLPAARAGESRILFGGLYDWYDPWTLLGAMEQLPEATRLYFVSNPNSEGTPQRLLGEVEAECRRRGWWDQRVQILPWFDADRRFDLLRDVDVVAAPHRPSLETRLSLRTRFLDALAAGCPVVVTEDGAMSRLVAQYEAGWVVAAGDSAVLAEALRQALADPAAKQRAATGAAALVEAFSWEEVLRPLVEFCRNPRRDPGRERFLHHPETVAPNDGLAFRIRRWFDRQVSS
jgi:glycosyltransferase involved in cell wall biosynthesis